LPQNKIDIVDILFLIMGLDEPPVESVVFVKKIWLTI